MSEELTTLIQVIELYGMGVGALGKAIKFSYKGANAGVNIARLKTMQLKMKLHFTSTGKHNTMKLRDLEKLTGGNYKILNIPIEDEKKLIKFYDGLKRRKVSFAELPDLCIGDGFTQIAYNPQDAEKVKSVVDAFKKKHEKDVKEISIEDYGKIGGDEGRAILDNLVESEYRKEKSKAKDLNFKEGQEKISSALYDEKIMDMIHKEELKERLNNKEYLPIKLDVDKYLVAEETDKYVIKLPGEMKSDKDCHCIFVKKKDAYKSDDGKEIFVFLKKKDEQRVIKIGERGIQKGSYSIKNEILAKSFIKNEKLEKVKKLGKKLIKNKNIQGR